MLFNSVDFAFFLTLVFLLHWTVGSGSARRQNVLLTLASYVFYGWWDYRYLSLVIISSLVDFFVGTTLERTSRQRVKNLLLGLSLAVNLGLLGVFKYYGFFVDSFVDTFRFFGYEIDQRSVSLVLPMGISFYTFQTMSYSIDVYRGKVRATHNLFDFLVYVSFFPQLVAGPIERAGSLLPQFGTARFFDYDLAVDGLRQMLWGFFKKVAIADQSARFVNLLLADVENTSGGNLALASFLFSVQIYADFSGYSDIAIGVAKLFGVRLNRNFECPYFSRDIVEFWRRWHVSLSSWFKDYVYIPLGGNRRGTAIWIRNVFAVFLLSGLWHGASWTFVLWGAVHGVLFTVAALLQRRSGSSEKEVEKPSQWLREMVSIAITFALVTLAWVLFRAESVNDALTIYTRIFSPSLIEFPHFRGRRDAAWLLGLVLMTALVEYLNRREEHPLKSLGLSWPRAFRLAVYYGILAATIVFAGPQQEFVYFQF